MLQICWSELWTEWRFSKYSFDILSTNCYSRLMPILSHCTLQRQPPVRGRSSFGFWFWYLLNTRPTLLKHIGLFSVSFRKIEPFISVTLKENIKVVKWLACKSGLQYFRFQLFSHPVFSIPFKSATSNSDIQ